MELIQAAAKARTAAIQLAAIDGNTKNKALKAISEALLANTERIKAANAIDLENSKKQGLEAPLMKRLNFAEEKLQDVVEGIKSLIELEEPVGKVQMQTELDEGLILTRIACPIGVIGVIFESRPDALVQISTLGLKSGNAVLLKGGSEAKETNRILFEIIKEASTKVGIPEGWIVLLESREDVNAILGMEEYIDLLIPRGSNAFVSYIMKHTNIPVMGHADGICHVYVDALAELPLAVEVVTDSKTQSVAVCNALETLLVHKDIAKTFLPAIKESLEGKGVMLKGCEHTQEIISVEKATEEDWRTEYLDYILSIKIVDDLEEAINHINTYGSGHTDCIVTKDQDTAEKFMMLVDSGNVFHNASTRFSDGFRYGFGAEVGISTSKLHARGPVGLEGLLIYKYRLCGQGQIVEDYATRKKQFTHNRLI